VGLSVSDYYALTYREQEAVINAFRKFHAAEK